MPCGTFNIVNTGGRVRDVAPPQMCQVPESSRDSGDDYREKPEGRGARQTERDLESGDWGEWDTKR